MEATIFDYIDSILHSKKYIDDIKHDETQYNGFMCNRWISMHSDTTAEIINETSNKYWSQLTQQQDHYDFLLNLLPSYKRSRINYIKKIKEDKTDSKEDHTHNIAKKVEISTREVLIYNQLLNTLK